jgi:micrococcal nuclease
MKKILFFIGLFFICINYIYAREIEVAFSACVDGDTAKFIYEDKEITARFLAIDTPETVHPKKDDEAWGKEASNYTCDRITNADKLILEFDDNSDELDKYDRYLVWVFVDGDLLQKKLIELGFAKVAYLYGDYKYTNILKDAQIIAEEKKIGIWEIETGNDKPDYLFLILGIILFIIINILNIKLSKKKKFKKRLLMKILKKKQS